MTECLAPSVTAIRLNYHTTARVFVYYEFTFQAHFTPPTNLPLRDPPLKVACSHATAMGFSLLASISFHTPIFYESRQHGEDLRRKYFIARARPPLTCVTGRHHGAQHSSIQLRRCRRDPQVRQKDERAGSS